MMAFLDHLNQEGHTIIMITHDMQLMLEHCDRTLVLSQGQIIADDQPQAILSDADILEKAYLKKTSLFHLAEKLHCSPLDLTDYYITMERKRHVTETPWLSEG